MTELHPAEQRQTALFGRVAWFTVVVLALVPAVVVVVLDIAVLAPVFGLLSAAAALAIPVLGPLLIVVALPAVVLGFWRRRRGPRRMSIVTGGFGAAGAVLSVVLVAVMMSAISDAGGSVNLFRALAPSSVTAGEPDVHEVYATVDSQPLSVAVYRPRGAVRPAPTLFYIHGGGWTSGSETDLPTQMRWFADRGWVVVSAQYRLATTTDHTWDRASTDVACALSWTVRNAAQFGADPSRLVVMGQSAGGNLALNLAYGAAAGRASSACGGVVPVPRAVAVDYPAVDPARLYDNDFTIGSFAIHDAAAEYVGGSPQQYPDRYRATSSASFITAKAPPTLIIQGEQDSLVPPDSVYGFADQARAAQVDITLAKIPFVNHSYDGLTAGSLGTQAFLTTSQNYLEKRVQP